MAEHFLGENPRHLLLGESNYVRVKKGKKEFILGQAWAPSSLMVTDKQIDMKIRLEFLKALQGIVVLDLCSLPFLKLFCAQSKVMGQPLSAAQAC